MDPPSLLHPSDDGTESLPATAPADIYPAHSSLPRGLRSQSSQSPPPSVPPVAASLPRSLRTPWESGSPAPRCRWPLLLRSPQARPVSAWQTTPVLPPPSRSAAAARSALPPAASAPPVQRSCRAGPLVRPSTPPPRSRPSSSPSPPPALRIHAPHTHRPPVPAAPFDPASRWPSSASLPDPHTPPAPCTPASAPPGDSATPPPPLPLPLHRPALSRLWCNRPPAACPRPSPPAPPPPLPSLRDVPSAALRSLPTQSDIPGSSPDHRSVPQTRSSRPAAISPYLPSCTSALPDGTIEFV